MARIHQKNEIKKIDKVNLEIFCNTKPLRVDKKHVSNWDVVKEKLLQAKELDYDFVPAQIGGWGLIDVASSLKNNCLVQEYQYCLMYVNCDFVSLLEELRHGSGNKLILILDTYDNLRGVIGEDDFKKDKILGRVYLTLLELENLITFLLHRANLSQDFDTFYKSKNYFNYEDASVKDSKFNPINSKEYYEYVLSNAGIRVLVEYFCNNYGMESTISYIKDIVELRNAVAHPRYSSEYMITIDQGLINTLNEIKLISESARKECIKINKEAFYEWEKRWIS